MATTTLKQYLDEKGMTMSTNDDGTLTVTHDTDAMATVGVAAGLVGGAAEKRFVWLAGGHTDNGGAWATLRARE